VALSSFFRWLFGPLLRLWRFLRDGTGFDVAELARRLDVPAEQLQEIQPSYQPRQIPKRSGGKRLLFVPSNELKALQRRLLRRLLKRLRCHPAARGFQRGESIVTNALPHAGRAVVVKLDLHEFFPSTRGVRIYCYFRRIGWNRPAAALLTKLCTHHEGLPQGAPTSPRLSNLVNYRLDRRIAAMANKLGAHYTRYADDITLSFAEDDRRVIRYLIRFVRRVVAEEGYLLHGRKKRHIRRRHQQQRVTGLVVNDGVHLPRRVRRWLRAVEHHLAAGRPATLTAQQLAGWRALCQMIAQQAPPADRAAPQKTPGPLQGTWVMSAVEHEGRSAPAYAPQEGPDPVVWIFEPALLRIVQGRREKRATFTVDEASDPHAITITPLDGLEAGVAVQGIWLRQGDQLAICLAEGGRDRPGAFTAGEGSGQTVFRLRIE
jgi:RNA-directed DNA polymerase